MYHALEAALDIKPLVNSFHYCTDSLFNGEYWQSIGEESAAGIILQFILPGLNPQFENLGRPTLLLFERGLSTHVNVQGTTFKLINYKRIEKYQTLNYTFLEDITILFLRHASSDIWFFKNIVAIVKYGYGICVKSQIEVCIYVTVMSSRKQIHDNP